MGIKSEIISNLLKILHKKINPSIYDIDNNKIYLCKNVFSPFSTLTSKFLADNLILKSHWNVIDMGTGSGYIAIRISNKVNQVLATDINPLSVRCAKLNVKLNNLQNKIKVIQSNLFSNIAKDKYSSIIFNPPYLKGYPDSMLEKAWSDSEPEDIIKIFINQAEDYLEKNGLIQIAYSTLGPINLIKKIFLEKGFKLINIINKKLIWETISILQYKKKS